MGVISLFALFGCTQSGSETSMAMDVTQDVTSTSARGGSPTPIAAVADQGRVENSDATAPSGGRPGSGDAEMVDDASVPAPGDAQTSAPDMMAQIQTPDAMTPDSPSADAGPVGGGMSPAPDAVAQCMPQAMRRCVDGAPHWFDSCGRLGEQIEACEDGQLCQQGECTCDPAAPGPVDCDGADVVQRDGCQMVLNVVEVCGPNKICADGRCLIPNCEPAAEMCDGQDNDCDGTLDEAAPCPPGLSCANGRCGVPGTQCHPCGNDMDCADGYVCGNYQNFPELGGVCAKVGCVNDADCANGSACDANGICWMVWEEQCLGENPWNIDSCGRRVRQIEECDPGRPCQDGRCIGAGELCGECEGDGDCAQGFRCRGYANFPEIPQICVPESDCNTNPDVQCPDGLQCSPAGVCWMTLSFECRDDGDRWATDTCNRTLGKVEDCPQNSVCREERCVGAGELCAECEADGDCALGYVCRGYANFPDIPNVCVPESDCATNPNAQCPAPLTCGLSGVCWLGLSPLCVGEKDVWQFDTCGRQVFQSATCPGESLCDSGRCIGLPMAGAPAGGAQGGGANAGGANGGGANVGGMSGGGTPVGALHQVVRRSEVYQVGSPADGGPIGGNN